MEKSKLIIKQGCAERTVFFSGEPILLDLLRDEEIVISAPCGGCGRCGGCGVCISGSMSTPDAAEQAMIDQKGIADMRLACRTRLTGDCRLILDEPIAHAEFFGMEAERVGAAVDIGTTTVNVMLIRMTDDAVLCRMSELNAQRLYGADVMSRISACDEGAAAQLHNAITAQINSMLGRCAEGCGIGLEDIEGLAVTGNTVMLHLAAGIDPTPVGVAPYIPQELFGRIITAKQSGLCTDAYFMPCTGGFTGGDLTACLAVYDMKNGELLCDLGTNGELAFRYNDRFYITSAAAGPALEGGGISCGSGAVEGAVSRIYNNKGGMLVEVIGGGRARTLCGGALVSAAAIMLEDETIEPTGRMTAEQRHIAGDVSITPQDIRQLQLAKGAVAAAMLRLVQFAQAQPEEVSRVIFTGGLGCFTEPTAAARIGLIPPALKCGVEYIPALAVNGAAVCLTAEGRACAEEIARQCECLALDGDSDFTDLFIECMEFPEGDIL